MQFRAPMPSLELTLNYGALWHAGIIQDVGRAWFINSYNVFPMCVCACACACVCVFTDSREETVLGSIPLPSYVITPVDPDDHISRKYAFKVTPSWTLKVPPQITRLQSWWMRLLYKYLWLTNMHWWLLTVLGSAHGRNAFVIQCLPLLVELAVTQSIIDYLICGNVIVCID